MSVETGLTCIFIALTLIKPSYSLITPPQVLLPYISNESGIVIRAQLRATPTRCVFWSTPTPDTICLTSPACLGDSNTSLIKNSSICDCQVASKCLEAVWVGAKKSITLPYRTWVSISDRDSNATVENNSFAEVIVKALESIDFQTRNRKIAVGQLATLRLVGFDEDKNTFTSLQGIPFKIDNSDGSVMKISDLTNDPDEATPTRMHLVKGGLYSDVIVVQGLKVGESVISLHVDLPEYKHIGLSVKFMVSEPFILEPVALHLPIGSKVNFCLRRINQEASSKDSKADIITLPHSYYKWSCDSPVAERLTDRGQLSLKYTLDPAYPDQKFTVDVTDTRSGETSTASISTSKPVALAHSIRTLSSTIKGYPDTQRIKHLLEQWDNEELAEFSPDAFFWHKDNEEYSATFDKLYRAALWQCQSFPPTPASAQLPGRGEGATNDPSFTSDFSHLSIGRTYLFKLSLLDGRGREFSIPDNAKLSLTLDVGKSVKILWRSPINHLLVFYTNELGDGSFKFSLTSVGYYAPDKPIEYTVKYRVNRRLHIEGRNPSERLGHGKPLEDKRLSILRHFTSIPISPIYLEPPLPVKEGSGGCYSIRSMGGSGVFYALSDGDAFSVTSDSNRVKICPRTYGHDIVTIEDSLDPANVYLLPVHSVHVDFVLPYPSELHAAQDDYTPLYLLPIAVDKSRPIASPNPPFLNASASTHSIDASAHSIDEVELRLAAYGWHIVRNFNPKFIKIRHSSGLSIEQPKSGDDCPFRYMVNGLQVGIHDVEIDFQGVRQMRVHIHETIKLSISPAPFHPLSKPSPGSPVTEETRAPGGLFSFFYANQLDPNDGEGAKPPSALEPSDEHVFLVGSRTKVLVHGGATAEAAVTVEADATIFKVQVEESAFYLTCLREVPRSDVLVSCAGPSRLLPVACSYPAYSRIVPYDMGLSPVSAEGKEVMSARGKELTLASILYDRRGLPIAPNAELTTHWYQVHSEGVRRLCPEGSNFYLVLSDETLTSPLQVVAVAGWRMGDRESVQSKSYAKTLNKFGYSTIYAHNFDRQWTGTMDAIFEASLTVNLVGLPSIVPSDNLHLPTRDLYYLMALDLPMREHGSGDSFDAEYAQKVISSFSAPPKGGGGRGVFMWQGQEGMQYDGREVVSLLGRPPAGGERYSFLIDANAPGEAVANFTVKDVLNSRGGVLSINFVELTRVGLSVWLCHAGGDCTQQAGPEDSLVHLQAGLSYVFVLTAYGAGGMEIYPPALKGLRAEVAESGGDKLHFQPLSDAAAFAALPDLPADLAFTLVATQGEFLVRGSIHPGGKADSGAKRVQSGILTIKSFKPFRAATRELVLLPGTAGFEFDLVDGPGAGVGRALGFRYNSSNEAVVAVGAGGAGGAGEEGGLLTAKGVGDATVTLEGNSGIGAFSLSASVRVRVPRGLSISPPTQPHAGLGLSGPHAVRAGRWVPLAAVLTAADGLIFTPHYLAHASGAAGEGGGRAPVCEFLWDTDNALVGRVDAEDRTAIVVRFHGLTPGTVNVILTATCGRQASPLRAAYAVRVVEDARASSELYARGLQYSFHEASLLGTRLVSYSARPASERVLERVGHLVRTDGDRLVSVVGVEVVDSFYIHARLVGDQIAVELLCTDGRPVERPPNLPLVVVSSRQGVVNGLRVDHSSGACAPVLVFLEDEAAPYSTVVVCGRGRASKMSPEGAVLLPGGAARFSLDPTRYMLYLTVPRSDAASMTPELIVSELAAVYRPVVVEEVARVGEDATRASTQAAVAGGDLLFRVTFTFASPGDNAFNLQERIVSLVAYNHSGVDSARARLEDMLRAERLPAVAKSLSMALSLLPPVSRYVFIPRIDWYRGVRHARLDARSALGDGSEGDGYLGFDRVGLQEVQYAGHTFPVEVVDELAVSLAYHNGSDYYSLSDEPFGDFTLIFKPFIGGKLYYSTEFTLTGLFSLCTIDDEKVAEALKCAATHVPLIKDGEVISLPACRCGLGGLDALASVGKFDPKGTKLRVSLNTSEKRYFERDIDLWTVVKSTAAFYSTQGELVTRVALGQAATVVLYPASRQMVPRLKHRGKPCTAIKEERRGLVIYLTIVRIAADSQCSGHVADVDIGTAPGVMSFISAATPTVAARNLEIHALPAGSSFSAPPSPHASAVTPVLTVVLVLLVSYYISRRVQAQAVPERTNCWGRPGYLWSAGASPWISHQHSSRAAGISIQRDHMPKVVQDLYSPSH